MTSLDQSYIDAVVNRRQRDDLRDFKDLRQEAIALFPLMVHRAAETLMKISQLRQRGVPLLPDTDAAADCLEAEIRACFMKTFGHDMIASEDQPNVS